MTCSRHGMYTAVPGLAGGSCPQCILQQFQLLDYQGRQILMVTGWPVTAAPSGPEPLPDETAAIRAVIAEPLGLGDDGLPAYGKPGPGDCRQCLGPRDSGSTLCTYCTALAMVIAGRSRPGREFSYAPAGTGLRIALLITLAVSVLNLLWITGVLT